MQAERRQQTQKTLTLSERFAAMAPKKQAKPAKPAAPAKPSQAKMHIWLLQHAADLAFEGFIASDPNLGAALRHLNGERTRHIDLPQVLEVEKFPASVSRVIGDDRRSGKTLEGGRGCVPALGGPLRCASCDHRRSLPFHDRVRNAGEGARQWSTPLHLDSAMAEPLRLGGCSVGSVTSKARGQIVLETGTFEDRSEINLYPSQRFMFIYHFIFTATTEMSKSCFTREG